MNFLNYLEDHIWQIIFFFSLLLFLGLYLLLLNIHISIIIVFLLFTMFFFLLYLIANYRHLKKEYLSIIQSVDELKEKYYIAEILPKPTNLKNQAYYYALKKACKAMNDKLTNMESTYKEYQEYLESFIHEIKTPIAAISLYCDNTKNADMKQEINKIDNYVEQVLYYARSENPEKDYFVRELALEEVIHTLLLQNKEYLLKEKVNLNVHDVNKTIFTDEKWLLFILNQIIQNALKYLDKKEKQLEITTEESATFIKLMIKDNGIGISAADIPRVFEKGFTGNNRKKKHATGLGLYLCHQLCQKLNLELSLTSKEQSGTTVTITFPKTDTYVAVK